MIRLKIKILRNPLKHTIKWWIKHFIYLINTGYDSKDSFIVFQNGLLCTGQTSKKEQPVIK